MEITNDLFLCQFNGSFSTLIFCDLAFQQATLALFSFPSFHEMWCWLIWDQTLQVFLFLSGHSFWFSFTGTSSSSHLFTAGDHQGSSLGNLLFSLDLFSSGNLIHTHASVTHMLMTLKSLAQIYLLRSTPIDPIANWTFPHECLTSTSNSTFS